MKTYLASRLEKKWTNFLKPVSIHYALATLSTGMASDNRKQFQCRQEKLFILSWCRKGRFTRYNFVACDVLTTGLRHELFRVNQTYNLLAIVVYDMKNVVGF